MKMLHRSSIALMAALGVAFFTLSADPALAKKKPRVGLPIAPCAPVGPDGAPVAGNPGGEAAPGAVANCGPFAVDPELVALRERVIGLEATNRSLASALEDSKFQLTRARTLATEDRRVIADLSARNVALQNEIAARDAEIARLSALPDATGAIADPAGIAGAVIAASPGAASPGAASPGAESGAVARGPRALAPGAAPPAAGAPAAGARETADATLARARTLLVNEDYAGAQKVLSEFLSTNGTHVMAADAQYYLGEALYLRGDAFVEAAEAYLKVVKTWPKSARAPDSFVKLAASLRQLGEKQRACDTLVEFGKRYPKPAAAVRTRAASEARAAGCAS